MFIYDIREYYIDEVSVPRSRTSLGDGPSGK